MSTKSTLSAVCTVYVQLRICGLIRFCHFICPQIIWYQMAANSGNIECSICRMDRSIAEMHDAPCGHRFCRWCLETHYRLSIANGTVSFECMEEVCDRPISEEELMPFLDPVTRSKFHKFARNIRLVQDPDIRWCVKSGCEHEIRRKNKRQKRMECGHCGTAICYDCAGLYHNTTSGEHDCDIVKRADSKLSQWANTGGVDVQFSSLLVPFRKMLGNVDIFVKCLKMLKNA